MDKTTKTVLIVIGVIVVLCACAVVAVFVTGLWTFNTIARVSEQSVSGIPQEVVRVGADIADFEVPEGFGSPYGVHFGEVFMLVYTSQSERSHILLAQFPEGAGMDAEEMLRQLEGSPGNPDRIWFRSETELIEQRPITIRGEQTALSIHEGTSSEGATYRMAIAPFPGRGGPALAMVVAPVDEWDIAAVEEFFASIQ